MLERHEPSPQEEVNLSRDGNTMTVHATSNPKMFDSIKERNDFERRTAFATLTNRSKYFGYDLYTIVGFQRDEKLFDDEFRHADEFGVWSFFVRALIGFSEYGRPI